MKKEKIQAYLLRVNKQSGVVYRGYIGEMENSLGAVQAYVNYDEPYGLITVISITDNIDVITNSEGKIKSFPINRFVIDDDGGVWEMLVGNVMCVRHNKEGKFSSILPEDIATVERYLVAVKPEELIEYKKAE